MLPIQCVMKNLVLFILLIVGVSPLVKAQEIIPFPDLSENHIAVYNQAVTLENHDYTLFSKDYQDALEKIDLEIEALHVQIGSESSKSNRTSLQSEKNILVKKRSALLQEAELLEDLNKFY